MTETPMKSLPLHRDKRFKFAGMVIFSLLGMVLLGKEVPPGVLNLIEVTTLAVLVQSKFGDFVRAKWGPKEGPGGPVETPK